MAPITARGRAIFDLVADAAEAYDQDKTEVNKLALQIALLEAEEEYAKATQEKLASTKARMIRNSTPEGRARQATMDKIFGAAEELDLEKSAIEHLTAHIKLHQLEKQIVVGVSDEETPKDVNQYWCIVC